MGWLSLLAPQGSPFASFLANNQNAIHGVGAGLASGTDFSNGLGLAAQYAAQGAQKDSDFAIASKKEQERLDNIQKAQEWLRANFPKYAGLPSDLGIDLAKVDMTQAAKAPTDLADTSTGRAQLADQYGLTGTDKTDFVLTGKLPGGNQTARAGVGQPVYFQSIKDPNVIRAVQPMTTGAGQDMLTGGTLPGDPSDWRVIDPATMAGQKSQQTVDAKTAGAARAALPAAQQAFDMANKAADALLGDQSGMADQFGNFLGVPNQIMPVARPGSDMARFRSELEQAQGNAFLQARNVLKGAGQVTDYEGAKAEGAYSRMVLAAKNNNQEEFISAVQDFKAAVAEGYAKLQAAANGEYAAGRPAVTGGGASIDDLVKKYGG